VERSATNPVPNGYYHMVSGATDLWRPAIPRSPASLSLMKPDSLPGSCPMQTDDQSLPKRRNVNKLNSKLKENSNLSQYFLQNAIYSANGQNWM